MENNKQLEALIDAFLMKELGEEAARSFRLELERDPGLAKQVELRRELINGLEAYGRRNFKEELNVIHKEVVHQPSVVAKKRQLWPYLAAVASVLILVMAIAWLMNGSINKNPDQLYAAYFKPYDITGTQRSKEDEDMIRIEQLYKAGDYSTVLPMLESRLNDTDVKLSQLLLAAGIANLELDQPEVALDYFKQIISTGDFNFEEEVRWYSALAYLKLKDLPAARTLVETLAQDASADHHHEAQDLLKELEQ